jgi:hypothetical protein
MSDKEGATKKMSNEITSLKPFKHAPSIEISTTEENRTKIKEIKQ